VKPGRKKIALIVAVTLAGLLTVAVVTSLVVVQTQWFSDFVRGKIVSSLEDSTGGRVEIGSLQISPGSLTIRIRDLVLHGTEPKSAAPLAHISLLELRLKLLSKFTNLVDLAYLGVTEPRVNIIVNADGSTNIPQPKVKNTSSASSSLEDVVDLAVGEFRIERGLIAYSEHTEPIDMRGENLRALLQYDELKRSYQGHLRIDPLRIVSGANPPLPVRVDLALNIEKNALRATNVRLTTALSQISLDASIANLDAPRIAVKMAAKVSKRELAATFGLPLNNSAPAVIYANLDGQFDQQANRITLPGLHVAMGKTTIDASGQGQSIAFNANLALAELSRLMDISSPEITGDLVLHGTASADSLAGTMTSRGLALRDASTHLSNISISAPFHVTPHTISLDEIKVGALGGSLTASVLVEELRTLAAKGTLHDFSLATISSVLAGHSVGYDAQLAGSIGATVDLKAKGTSGITAHASIRVTPGQHNIPVKGELSAIYTGADGSIDVNRSYLVLPHSRVDLSGSLGKEIKIALESRNLNDFLPLANFSSATPIKSLPVNVEGRGTAAISASITGPLPRARITANATITNFAVHASHFDRLALNLFASPSELGIRDGSLSGQRLGSTFDGSLGLVDWRPRGHSPVVLNLNLQHGDIRELVALAGGDDKSARGDVTAAVQITGTYGNPLGHATVQASHGEAYGQPFDRADARVSLSDRLVRLETLELAAPAGLLSASGSFRHPADSMTSGHVDVQVSANSIELAGVNALQQSSPGTTGVVKFDAKASAAIANDSGKTKLTISNVDADVSARALRINGEDAGSLTASAHTLNGNVVYRAASNFAGSDVKIDGSTALSAGYYTKANAAISNLSVSKVLAIANRRGVPVSGLLSADAQVKGSFDSPDVAATFRLTKANVYQEPIDSLAATIHYNNTLLDIASLDLKSPAGSLRLSGSYVHDAGAYHGVLAVHVPESELQISKIEHAQSFEPGLTGALRLAADINAQVSDKNGSPELLPTGVKLDLSGKGLRVADHNLGGLTLSAHTANSKVAFQLDSDLVESQIHASGETQLTPAYPIRVNLTFKNVRYENLSPFLDSDSIAPPLFKALVEGQASLHGSLLHPRALTARLELSALDLHTNPRATPTGVRASAVEFSNQGPILITLDKSVAKIDQMHMRGPHTSLDVSGSIDVANNTAPLQVSLNATADLGMLQTVSRSFYSSGTIAVNAVVRGAFAHPLLNGKIELHNANINYADAPNGLSNGNGVILLNGTTASIQNLTGESGGGKIVVAGFVGLSPRAVIYNLQARATKVRTRYGQVSVTTSADVTLTGNSNRSLLAGSVRVQRIAYSSSSDIGSLLYNASAPPSTTIESSPLLSSMRLDIRIVTASDVRVVTSFVQKLSLTSSLIARGTAAQPGLTGRVVFTDGQLVFFGNTYDVRTGTINFYDPSSISPILDLSLETVAQGVDVVLGVTGPVSDMKLSYRSDPPLTFQQIVQLLATNTTPFDATIASQQPSPAPQSVSQMGESAILGQAVANPIASRVQRVFGLSQFKIDPSIAGSNGQPSARVTLQQKIASNLTFTYITDVTQTNSEIVRVTLDISAKTSVVALRDYNGNVSLELFYKFQKR
jgi:translocation and assembly module TamB